MDTIGITIAYEASPQPTACWSPTFFFSGQQEGTRPVRFKPTQFKKSEMNGVKEMLLEMPQSYF